MSCFVDNPRSLFCRLVLTVAFGAGVAAFGDAQAIELTQSVLASGGGKTSGGSYTVSTTLGQVIVGGASGGTYSVSSGFWAQLDAALSSVDPEIETSTPTSFTLGSVEPNPFTNLTSVNYALPKTVSQLRIQIFDASGRRVRRLIDGPQEAGRFTVTWNGMDDRGVPAVSGIYFCQMVTEGFQKTVKIVARR